jgi:class 3 adenylate cyclase
MTVSQTNFEAIDQARQAVAGEAGHLGGAGDAFTGGCGTGIFGKLNPSAQLAAAVNALAERMRTELGAAERLLRLVESAIGAVETTVRNVDDDAARRLSTTVA